MAVEPILELVGISKAFGGVQALRDVDLALAPGEIHGLVGENGAGKSTLMKIIAGVHPEFGGIMRVRGREVRFRASRDALAAGIGMVHQELSIAPDLSVAENVYLGAQPTNRFGMVDWGAMRRGARDLLSRLGLEIDVDAPAGLLPIGVQQLVELGRVLFSGAEAIILDEPTSALSPPETERLFEVLRRLKAEGRSIIFISHFLDDILRISDVVSVFRNGRKVVTERVSPAIDKGWLIERMIGAQAADLEESWMGSIQLATPRDAPVAFEAVGLTHAPAFRDVSFQVRAGEALGVYGYMGCGQIELSRALFGKIQPRRGAMRIGGQPARLSGAAAAKRAGMAFVPESRRAMLFAEEPIYRNISISILETISRIWVKPDRERAIAAGHIQTLGIRAPGPSTRLGALSGGNQQKVALARWLTRPPRVLVLCEPTRGMDVGAKEDVVRIVRSLKEQGIAVIVLSTEPETVLSMADRILVLRRGEVVREFADMAISKEDLLAAA
ncbi:ABC transporter ATP-binding protein [Alsobacter metallidurans]|uniref:ABC transporter ATP-binding protein n=1 Tax=Alsobacter metallidurans TaxID=340221 RepID=A0A917I4W6_9HYPH|nr:sugar ABC transporter ATP-binding protein [Alsobacter metallidurans]GGH10047.1 ABC transporter ATP-binding protein [Alsobacter metallidurans]